LPTVKELSSIVDFTVAGPAINQTAFPSTPADRFWTSSPYAGSSGYAWDVFFYDGFSSTSSTWAATIGCAAFAEDGDFSTLRRFDLFTHLVARPQCRRLDAD